MRRAWAWFVVIGKAALIIYGVYLGLFAHQWCEGTWCMVFGSL